MSSSCLYSVFRRWRSQRASGWTAGCAPRSGRIPAGGDAAVDADGGIELHDRAGHDAVESIDGGQPPEHGLVVHAAVHVDAGELAILRQMDFIPALDALLDDKAGGVVGIGLAQADEIPAIDQGDAGHHADAPPVKDGAVVAEEHHQESDEEQPDHRDGHIDPEAVGMHHEAEFNFPGFRVGVPAFGHQADEQGEGCCDAESPAERPFPVDGLLFGLLKAEHCCKHQHKHQHVVPAGIIDPVEKLEHGVEAGDNGAEKEDDEHPPQPVGVLAGLEIGDSARTAEHRAARPTWRPICCPNRGRNFPGRGCPAGRRRNG